MHYRMLSSIPGLHQLNATALPFLPVLTTQNIFGHCQRSGEGCGAPILEVQPGGGDGGAGQDSDAF